MLINEKMISMFILNYYFFENKKEMKPDLKKYLRFFTGWKSGLKSKIAAIYGLN